MFVVECDEVERADEHARCSPTPRWLAQGEEWRLAIGKPNSAITVEPGLHNLVHDDTEFSVVPMVRSRSTVESLEQRVERCLYKFRLPLNVWHRFNSSDRSRLDTSCHNGRREINGFAFARALKRSSLKES